MLLLLLLMLLLLLFIVGVVVVVVVLIVVGVWQLAVGTEPGGQHKKTHNKKHHVFYKILRFKIRSEARG